MGADLIRSLSTPAIGIKVSASRLGSIGRGIVARCKSLAGLAKGDLRSVISRSGLTFSAVGTGSATRVDDVAALIKAGVRRVAGRIGAGVGGVITGGGRKFVSTGGGAAARLGDVIDGAGATGDGVVSS